MPIIVVLMGAMSFSSDVLKYERSIPMAAAGLMLEASLILYMIDLLRSVKPRGIRLFSLSLHLGFALMIAGYMANIHFGETGRIYARVGMTVRYFVDEADRDQKLPFSLLCRDFHFSDYSKSLHDPSGFERISSQIINELKATSAAAQKVAKPVKK